MNQPQSFYCLRLGIPKSWLLNNSGLFKISATVTSPGGRPDESVFTYNAVDKPVIWLSQLKFSTDLFGMLSLKKFFAVNSEQNL